jgi:uncharacterized membrane protein
MAGVATAHMMTMATLRLCFLGALLLASSAPVLAAVGAALGFCLMAVGGWLGGRLIYEFGIGVAPCEKLRRGDHALAFPVCATRSMLNLRSDWRPR